MLLAATRFFTSWLSQIGHESHVTMGGSTCFNCWPEVWFAQNFSSQLHMHTRMWVHAQELLKT